VWSRFRSSDRPAQGGADVFDLRFQEIAPARGIGTDQPRFPFLRQFEHHLRETLPQTVRFTVRIDLRGGEGADRFQHAEALGAVGFCPLQQAGIDQRLQAIE